MHTAQEKAVLKSCGCKPLHHNERAMRVCTTPTCFYMPHCPFPLANNLIWANWFAPWRVTIIGNDLAFHALHNHPFATVAPHLHRAMQIANAVRLPDTFTPSKAFAKTLITDGSREEAAQVISSSQIFGLSMLYTFPARHHWETAAQDDALGMWLREGRPELPSPENFVHRLTQELQQTRERATWLERRLARAKVAARL